MQKPGPNLSIFWNALILGLVCTVTFLHYGTHTHETPLHALYRKLYYLPILLSAIRYGLKGGLGCSLLCAGLYFPHLHFDWGADYLVRNADKSLEVLLYQVVGIIVGLYADHQNRLRTNLEEAHKNLQQKTETLVKAQNSLYRHEKLQAMALLGAGISHEIRNPLASLKGILEMGFQGKNDNRKELEKIAIEEVGRIQGILDKFITLNAQDHRAITRVHLQEMLGRVVELMETSLKKKKIFLELTLPEDPSFFEGPEGILHQVVLNLILNSKDSGASKILVILIKDESGYELSIEDNGRGVPVSQVESVFDFFFTTREDGSGLGLSISSQLMEQIGGSLELVHHQHPTRFLMKFPHKCPFKDGSKHDVVLSEKGDVHESSHCG